jgi:hypothetical protein
MIDHVFVGSENESIYSDSVADVVWSAMEGLNGEHQPDQLC